MPASNPIPKDAPPNKSCKNKKDCPNQKPPPPKRVFNTPEEKMAAAMVDNYQGMFDMFDSDGDGFVNREEMMKGFEKLGWSSPDPSRPNLQAIDLLLRNNDVNNDNKLSLPEFVAAMEEYNKTKMEKDCAECKDFFGTSKQSFDSLFNWLDRDKDGGISGDDIALGMSKLTKKEVTPAQGAQIVVMNDMNKDGKLNKDEFFRAISRGHFSEILPTPDIDVETLMTQQRRNDQLAKAAAQQAAALANPMNPGNPNPPPGSNWPPGGQNPNKPSRP